MSPDPIRLEAEGLSCLRHDRLLFSGLGFRASSGNILQIDGDNGSGKTSLLRIICGLLPAESGTVCWNHQPVSASDTDFTSDLAWFGHKPGVKPELTPMENLALARHLMPANPDVTLSAILDDIGLRGYHDVPCSALSAGQRRRVGLARLFFTRCRLWILDEPFTALDKTGRGMIVDQLIRHSDNGGITLLTTHQSVDIPGKTVQKIHLDA